MESGHQTSKKYWEKSTLKSDFFVNKTYNICSKFLYTLYRLNLGTGGMYPSELYDIHSARITDEKSRMIYEDIRHVT